MPTPPSGSGDSLGACLAAYRLELEAEYGLLEQLRTLAARIRAAAPGHDVAALAEATAERDGVVRQLTDVESRCRPLRERLASRLDELRALPGFPAVRALHFEAGRLLAALLAEDDAALIALQDAQHSRRMIAQSLDAGGASLVAYRRALAPPLAHAEIFDERG